MLTNETGGGRLLRLQHPVRVRSLGPEGTCSQGLAWN